MAKIVALLLAFLAASSLDAVSASAIQRRQSGSADCRNSPDPVAQGRRLCPEGGDLTTLIANAQAAAALQDVPDTCQRDRQKICVFTCRRAVVLQSPGRFGETPEAFQTRIDANAARVSSRCSATGGGAQAPVAPAPVSTRTTTTRRTSTRTTTTRRTSTRTTTTTRAPAAAATQAAVASGNVDCRNSPDPVAQGRQLCPEGGNLNTLIANAQAAAALQNVPDTCQRDRQKICVFTCRRAVVLQSPGRFGETPEAFQTRIDSNAARVSTRC